MDVVVTPTGIPGLTPHPVGCKFCEGGRVDAQFLRVDLQEGEVDSEAD